MADDDWRRHAAAVGAKRTRAVLLGQYGFLTAVPVETTPAFHAGNPIRVLNTKYFQAWRFVADRKDLRRLARRQEVLMVKENPTGD